MDSKIKACIINAAIGEGWYQKGQERLITSLQYHGYEYDIIVFDEWPKGSELYDQSCPYNVKAAAFQWAIDKGYRHIIWMDCSAWVVKDITPLIDEVQEKGYYLGLSGYNCANTCTDKVLQAFNITRDDAERMSECASGIIGVNLDNEKASIFIDEFIKAAKDGLFKNSRQHSVEDSQDPRFLFGRQDQSVAAILANIFNLEMTPFGKYVSYYDPEMSDTTLIALRGM